MEFKEYASNQFLESFKVFGNEVYYVPAVSSTRSKFGEQSFSFDEASKVKLNVLLRRQYYSDGDLVTSASGRVNCSATFIFKQLQDNSIVMKERDAIDVVWRDGVSQRYVITAFSDDARQINPTDVYLRVELTELEKAFK